MRGQQISAYQKYPNIFITNTYQYCISWNIKHHQTLYFSETVSRIGGLVMDSSLSCLHMFSICIVYGETLEPLLAVLNKTCGPGPKLEQCYEIGGPNAGLQPISRHFSTPPLFISIWKLAMDHVRTFPQVLLLNHSQTLDQVTHLTLGIGFLAPHSTSSRQPLLQGSGRRCARPTSGGSHQRAEKTATGTCQFNRAQKQRCFQDVNTIKYM